MNKTNTRQSKREEKKKLMVRIVCLALVAVLAVTSLLTVIPSLFQQDEGYSVQDLIDAGILIVNEDGSYTFSEEYLQTQTEVDVEAEDHEGHDHE